MRVQNINSSYQLISIIIIVLFNFYGLSVSQMTTDVFSFSWS